MRTNLISLPSKVMYTHLKYQDESRKTTYHAPDHLPPKLGYMITGFFNELGEFIEKYERFPYTTANDVSPELGDVLWYFTQIIDILGLNFVELVALARGAVKPDNFAELYTISEIIKHAGRMGGAIKKYFRDNHDDTHRIQIHAIELLCLFIWVSEDELYRSFDSMLHENLVKLLQREIEGTIKGDGDDR